jgi:acylaminoacyl-peptidase
MTMTLSLSKNLASGLFIAVIWLVSPLLQAESISPENVQVLSTPNPSSVALSDTDYAKTIKQGLVDSISMSLDHNRDFKLFGQSTQWQALSKMTQVKEDQLHVLRFRLSAQQFSQGKLKLEGLTKPSVYLNRMKQSGDGSYKLDLLNGDYRVLVLADKVEDWTKVNLEWVADEGKATPRLTVDTGKVRLNAELMYDSETVSQISLSPDADVLLWSKKSYSPDTKDKASTITELIDPDSLDVLYRWQAMNPSSVNWSDDNRYLSYTHNNSVYLLERDGFEISKIADNMKGASGFDWFDNDTLIFSWHTAEDKPHKFTKRYRGLEDRWSYWRGNSQIYLLDIHSGFIKQLTQHKLSSNLSDYDANNQRLLLTRDPSDYTKPAHFLTQLIELDLKTSKERMIGEYRTLSSASYHAKGVVITAGPSFNDGAGEAIGDNQVANNYDGQLYLMDKSGNVKALSKRFNPSISGVKVLSDGQLLVSAGSEDKRKIYRYNFNTGKYSSVKTDIEVIESYSVSQQRKAKIVFKGTSATSPQKVMMARLGSNQTKTLVDTAKQSYSNVQLSELKDWDYTTKSGNKIDGRYYLPANFDSSKKYPTIIYYYGGTSPVSRSFTGRWPFSLWTAQGYVVYVLQPSGATGYGQEFSGKHVNAWGLETADDIIESTKAFVEAHPFVDGTKLGNMGASYGGFMTMYLATKTDLFGASVSHAGISNLTSYWGHGWWGYAYSGVASKGSFPWNKKEFYTQQSPVFHADKVTTPLLLLHGDSDTNVPVGESHQMYTALKLLDKDVELIEFQGDDHHINARTHRLRWWQTMIAYFDKKLKKQPEWWEHLYPSQP